MTEVRKIVSRNLRGMRDLRSMTQEVLAEVAGIDRSYLSQIENGVYGASIDKLEPLAISLGLEAWELLHPDTLERHSAKR